MPLISRRELVGLCAALLLAGAPYGRASAQETADYPSRPIRIVVPLAVGGITDIAARLVAEKLTEQLRQPVVVDNRPGASGMVAAELVAAAPADGYTLIMGTVSSHAINMSFYPNIKYNNLRDFAPLALVTQQPLLLVVHPSVPAKTLPDLVALLKDHPERYSFGTPGSGTSNDLATTMFAVQAGVKAVAVPYKGSGPMIVDLVAGNVGMAFDNLPTALAQVRTGKLRPIAVTSAERFSAVPDVPTVAETYPGFQVGSWQGLFAPAGTPAAILAKLTEAIHAVLQRPDVTARILEMGAMPGTLRGNEFRKFVADETERWGHAVKVSGIRQ